MNYRTVIRVRNTVVLLALLALVATLGEMDYQDAKLAERHYCEQVARGAWPAYRPEITCPVQP